MPPKVYGMLFKVVIANAAIVIGNGFTVDLIMYQTMTGYLNCEI
jgi:hypothetical protein